MKESGMDKLIELLNKEMEEKEKAGPKLARFTSYDGINKVFNLTNGCSLGTEFVLSKRYEFIKWLVYNDKIDFSWEGELSSDLVNLFERKVDNADGVIALLSISDTPIEDLISYLK